MLRFFRIIRKKLTEQHKVRSYILYAIGEILLVVLGILIALQVNNWNEGQRTQKQEVALLNDLHLEFESNRVKLDSIIQFHQMLNGATQNIMNLMGKEHPQLSPYHLDSLIYLSIDYRDFSPSQSVISEIIASGKLTVISSDTLRMLIFKWVSAMDETEEGYDTLDEMNQNLTLPFLTKHAVMKNIDFFGLGRANGRSNFDQHNLHLLHNLEYENVLDNQSWGLTNYIHHLQGLKHISMDILQRTKPE